MQELTVERALRNASASLRMEGISITNEQKKLAELVLAGKLSLAESLQLLHKPNKEE